jgi:hypothetical protein
MNEPLMGKELNEKHRINDDILTPEEICAAGLIYVPADAYPYETESGDIIEKSCRKSMLMFNHDWSDDYKEQAKKDIIEELKQHNMMYVTKVCLVPFADDMDYSGFCFNVRVIVYGGRKK